MHRSRLTVLMIDISEDTFDAGVDFWSGALGAEAHPPSSDHPYRGLKERVKGLDIAFQRIDAPSRYHLDIETDDVEAEVARLEALGASRLEKVESWWVMEAPGGNLFCVVPPQTDDFPGDAAVWGD